MGLTAALAKAAGLPLLYRGGMCLLSADDALALLDTSAGARVRVLGVEGFRVLGNEVRPDMDAIADFSGVASHHQTVLEARRFLNMFAESDLKFELVLEPDVPV